MSLPKKIAATVILLAVAGAAVWLLYRAESTVLTQEPDPEPVYWPLTGELAPDAASIDVRAVSVKIENSPAARPQAGLANADVVYETLSEGGIPRFNAIFHSSMSERVGPIRSARLSDVYLVPQYNALFAFSGANQTVRDRIFAAGIDELGMEGRPALYERDPARPAPHNVYARTTDLLAAAADNAYAIEGGPRSLLFGDVPGADQEGAGEAPAVASIAVPFSGGNDVLWTWDVEADRWVRDVEGVPHADEGSGAPYAAANVIVLFAEARETDMRDAAGSAVLDIRLDSEGDAVVLRDGRRYDVGWRAFADAPPRFITAEGEPFPLAVGVTWIEVVPPGHGVVIE